MVDKMFQPAYIGKVKLKNRIIMAPMGTCMMTADKSVSDTEIRYFEARAKGGAGLLFYTCLASTTARIQGHNLYLDDVAKIPMLHEITRAVHSHGAKIAIMLGLGLGKTFRTRYGELPKAPSPNPLMFEPDVLCEELTREEIYQIIEDYGNAAEMAKRANFDMVHIQGYGAYLIDQFMHEAWNRRTDEFGGSFENRMRFPLELIRVIQERCGRDYPIVFKMTPMHMLENGRTMEDGLRIAKVLEEAGVAAIQVDIGAFDNTNYEQIPPAYHQERAKGFAAAAKIKEVVSIPVFTQGKVGDPAEARAVFEEGLTDFVVLGRSFLADPDWPRKVREDRIEDIVPCICCTYPCLGLIETDAPVACAVNPLVSLEGVVQVTPAPYKKRVLVVGTGPAGVQAALTAAERGHEVELWEKSTSIGGALIPASSPVRKKEMRRLIEYYKAQIYKNPNIRLRMNRPATAEAILDGRFDSVILATGGKAVVPPVEGLRTEQGQLAEGVYMALDVLVDKYPMPGHKYLVIGGGDVGCETAMHLDYQGKEIVLLEMEADILREKASIQTDLMMRRMIKEMNVDLRLRTKLVRIEGHTAVVECGGTEERIDFDGLVLAAGFKPDYSLEEALVGKVEVITVGDADQPACIYDAVRSGFGAAMSV